MTFTARIEIHIRPDILDPEADATLAALGGLGFDTVTGLRRAKVIEVDLEAADQKSATALAEDMSRKLLSNPVMEDTVIRVEERSA